MLHGELRMVMAQMGAPSIDAISLRLIGQHRR
jgi:hypothetical protein